MVRKILILVVLTALFFNIGVDSVAAQNGNEYIVKGQENMSDSYDIKETFTISNTKYYVVNYTGVKLASSNMAKNKQVKIHQQRRENTRNYNYNIDIINAENIPDEELYKNINVAILDTGISTEHKKMKSVKWETSILSNNPEDHNGHGTHVAGIIGALYDRGSNVRGVAPNVSIYNVKILGSTGTGSNSDMAQGIIKARNGPDGKEGTEDDADIISISAGSGSNLAIQGAVEEVTPETTVIASAGNSGNIQYPAKFEETIAVSSVDENKDPSFLNAQGPEIDVAAPGSAVLSLENHGNGGFVKMSGTSMAAPHVSGAAALLLSKYNLNSNEVKQKIQNNTEDIEESGFDEKTGYGLIDISNLLNNKIPPDLSKINPDSKKVKIGENISFEYSSYGLEPQLSFSLGERNNFIDINKSKITIDRQKLNSFDIDFKNKSVIELKVSFSIRTDAGVESKSKTYELITEKGSKIELRDYSIEDDPLPYSKSSLNLEVVNNGLNSGKLNAGIFIGDKLIRGLDKSIKPGEVKNIKTNILFKEPRRYRVGIYSDTIQSKRFVINVSNSNRNIRLKNLYLEDDNLELGEETDLILVVENNYESLIRLRGSIKMKSNIIGRIKKNIDAEERISLNKKIKPDQIGSRDVSISSEALVKKRFVNLNVKENESRSEEINFNVKADKKTINISESLNLEVKMSNNKKKTEEFTIDVNIGNRTIETINSNVEPNEMNKIIKEIRFEQEGQKEITLLAQEPEEIQGETKSVKIKVEKTNLFNKPLLEEFEKPPKNTKELDKKLYEDLDGDENGTEIRPTIIVWSQLVQNPEELRKKLTKEQKEVLDWNKNGELEPGDMVKLYGEKVRAE